MKQAFKEFIIGFLYTFSNDKRGNSARKTTAFALMLCVAWVHLRFVDANNAVEVLVIDLLFVALLLGIVTAQNLIELKLGKHGEKTNDSRQDSTEGM